MQTQIHYHRKHQCMTTVSLIKHRNIHDMHGLLIFEKNMQLACIEDRALRNTLGLDMHSRNQDTHSPAPKTAEIGRYSLVTLSTDETDPKIYYYMLMSRRLPRKLATQRTHKCKDSQVGTRAQNVLYLTMALRRDDNLYII